jgi:hydroxyethylthiazole kinase
VSSSTLLNASHVARDLEQVRRSAPVVHNITNYVVMEPTANALLALGASPVMAHAPEEMGEIVGIASALVLNIGTLSSPWIESMHRAGTEAGARGIPVVLDPVGAGASSLRTRTAMALLERVRPAIVRGNASEILTLAGEQGGTRGVDSSSRAEEAEAPAASLARSGGAVVSVSGAMDVITDGSRWMRIHLDTPLMSRVTGMGCTASAVTGALAAVNPDPLEAAAHAMAIMGVAGRMASADAPAGGRPLGPGGFLPAFHDALFRMTGSDIERHLALD